MRDATAVMKRCPQCGRLLAHDSLRCGYCLTEVWDIEADTVAAPALSEKAGPAALSRVPGLRRLVTRTFALPKWLLLLVVVVVATGGWYGFQALRPERSLALPSSTARSLPAASQTWAGVDGNAAHTRHTALTPALAGADVAWQSDLGVSAGPPAADEARLYIPTFDNRIVALSVRDGSLAWIYEAPVPIGGTPIVAGGRVYLLTRGGDAVCLDAATGAGIWSRDLEANFFNSPALADGVLFAYGTAEQLYGLDSEDGRLLWSIGTGSQWATLGPVVSGPSIIIATDDAVKVYDRKSGSLTLEHPQLRVVGFALEDARIFSVSPNFISKVDPSARLPWWWGVRGAWYQMWVWGLGPEPPRFGLDWLTSVRPPGLSPRAATPDVFAPAVADGLVVVANADGLVRAFDTGSGAVRWSIEAGKVTGAPVSTAAGVLLPLRDAVSLRSAADGSEVARRLLPATSRRSVIVTSQGTFLADAEGRVIAIR